VSLQNDIQVDGGVTTRHKRYAFKKHCVVSAKLSIHTITNIRQKLQRMRVTLFKKITITDAYKIPTLKTTKYVIMADIMRPEFLAIKK
jgi:hypothetical protein